MVFQKSGPAEILTPFVECYFAWESIEPLEKELVVESPPNSYCSIAINCGDPYFIQNKKYERLKVPQQFVAGLSIYSYKLTLQGKIGIMGIVITPSTLSTLFGLNAFELTEKRIDLLSILPQDYVEKFRYLAHKLVSMIQRQQSLWLLLATVASFLSFKFPFYTGNIFENNMSMFKELDAGSNLFFFVLTGGSILISAITIFLYKDRKTQFKLSLGGILIAIILLILYFNQLKKFTNGNFALTAIFVLAILVGYIMAARGIWKDQKLVKSVDKLR